jgi:hypothetical protein
MINLLLARRIFPEIDSQQQKQMNGPFTSGYYAAKVQVPYFLAANPPAELNAYPPAFSRSKRSGGAEA